MTWCSTVSSSEVVPRQVVLLSTDKKKIRATFRDACHSRDGYKCRVCGWSIFRPGELELDAHHITDRNLMPNGGYVKENGISLCAECHKRAEVFHETGVALPGWAPDDLYAKIGSSRELAEAASRKLK